MKALNTCTCALSLALMFSLSSCGGSAPTQTGADTEPASAPIQTEAVSAPVTEEASPAVTFHDLRKPRDEASVGSRGVWWWHAALAEDPAEGAKALESLKDNGITEIYFHAGRMADTDIQSFIRSAAERGIWVAWLAGDARWILDGNSGGDEQVETYLDYQKNAPENLRFYALHLDVEPHQLAEFREDRASTLQLYSEFVTRIGSAIHEAGEKIEWDIPFWLDDDVVTLPDGSSSGLLDVLAQNSDTLTLMSYRDTAEAILDVSKTEIGIGKTCGCKIICGVETYSEEGDFVSFMEEGKTIMYEELD
ncbi:MAG: hypothetical protein MJ175_12625, partial [Clostridia bacterium]|nr:hypothetical protein [Clostridia bacterium]